ncbi:hypothetical protein KKE60_04785 [Patescibacteria group bacterium]|nr:hypothetical protein [Patescibacteria group bacterium]
MFGLITKRQHEREIQEAVDRAVDSAYKLGILLSQVKTRNGAEFYWNQIEAIYTTNVCNKGELPDPEE